MLAPWKKSCEKPREHIKKQIHYFANKGPCSQSYGFSTSHVYSDHKESQAPQYWRFWAVVFEKTLESPFDCREIKLVNHKGNLSWILIGKKDSKIEGKRRERQSMKWLDNITIWLTCIEQALRVGDGQRSLACCSPWCHKELDVTERLNWTSRKSTLNTHWKDWC